ncbi:MULTISPECIES: PKD domain-containing protein [unclassified Actinoplanes]|uniref:InlB B-repeat-containing protein n=1 Tax=unclassified Actinoplanes TaxID=2626549 RepID=UPI0002E4323D|nr:MULTISPECIES: PKD domain-containing protein [unclassified Actinoplanes]
MVAGLSTLTGVAGLAAAAVLGAGHGYHAAAPHLLAGAAWLPSAGPGEVELLDGSNAEVAARVPVAAATHDFDVVQHGSDAYVVDAVNGMVSRVSGATMTASPPVALVPGATTGVRVFAGDGVLYAVDTVHGLLAVLDPETLALRGTPRPLAVATDPGAAVLDAHGVLWALDTGAGNLTVVRGGESVVRRRVVTAGAGRLLLAGGKPVLVDLATAEASTLDRDGRSTATVRIDLGDDRDPAIGGSPDDARVYPTLRGTVSVCELTVNGCGRAITLTAAADRLGTPVENRGRLFVPEPAHGRVHIVDPVSGHVIRRTVLRPPGDLRLFVHDGMVFFNDPRTWRAGVIREDGSVVTVAKYDKRTSSRATMSPNAPVPTEPAPTPSRSVTSTPRVHVAGENPRRPSSSPPPVTPEVAVQAARPTVMVGEPDELNLIVTPGTPAPQSVIWTFGDEIGAEGPGVAHTWPVPGTYDVEATATFAHGVVVSARTSVQVTDRPTLAVNAPAGGTVTGPGIACPGDCDEPLDGRSGTLGLTAVPAAGFVLAGWSGDCAGTAPECVVDTTTSRTVGVTFKRLPISLIELAPSATWDSGEGPAQAEAVRALGPPGSEPAPPTNPPVLVYAYAQGLIPLNDGSAPAVLELQPSTLYDVKDPLDPWIQGDFALPSPVVSGDQFRSRIAFRVRPEWEGNVTDGDPVPGALFAVEALMPDDHWKQISGYQFRAPEATIHDFNFDLGPAEGATKIRIRIYAGELPGREQFLWIEPSVQG